MLFFYYFSTMIQKFLKISFNFSMTLMPKTFQGSFPRPQTNSKAFPRFSEIKGN